MNRVKILLFVFFVLVLAHGFILQAKLATKADLEFKSIVLNKTRVQQGKTVNVRLSIVKNGDATRAFFLDVYLSKSTNLKSLTGDKRIFRISLSALAKGSITINKSRSYKIPALVRPGRYYVVAVVDPSNQVKETSETNNTGHAGLTVEHYGPTIHRPVDIPRPDLVIYDFSVRHIYPRDTNRITIYFKNRGKVTVKNMVYRIRVFNKDPDGVWWPRGRSDTTIAVVPPGYKLVEIRATFWIDYIYPNSKVEICVTLDPNNAFIESVEGNNSKCKIYNIR